MSCVPVIRSIVACVSKPMENKTPGRGIGRKRRQKKQTYFEEYRQAGAVLLPPLGHGVTGDGTIDVYTEHLAGTFFSVLSSLCSALDTFTLAQCVRVGQVDTMLRAVSETFHPHAMSLLNNPIISSFCSTPPPTRTPSPATPTGIGPNTCAAPPWHMMLIESASFQQYFVSTVKCLCDSRDLHKQDSLDGQYRTPTLQQAHST